MGLDMYLNKNTYVGAMFPEFSDVKGTVKISRRGVELPIKFERISHISEEVMYWRKANAIHQWFVDNVQDGIDNCQVSYVPFKKLEELLEIVTNLLVSKSPELAEKLLPPQAGFFFGGTEIDNWYWEDLQLTREGLTKIIEEEKTNQEKYKVYGDYYYHSSW